LDLIREQGPEAVNVAAVSTRSGIARTTIYRRYRDRKDLLRAALRPVTERGAPPQAASVREKFVWVLARTQEVLVESIGLGGLAAAVTDSDPEFSAALRAALHSGLEPIQEQVAHDVGSGRLPPHVDADILVNIVVGACLGELVRYRVPRPGWLERTADLLATSLAATPGR
jgi:AcrR family transcriptional regulator